MARLSIDSTFFGDSRIEVLSNLIKESKYSAQGRLLNLWSFCYHKIKDELTEQEINIHSGFGPGFATALVDSDLAEKIDSGYRIKGIHGRIDYLIQASENGKKSAKIRQEKYGTPQPASPKVPSGNPEGSPKVARRSAEPIPIPIPIPIPNPKEERERVVAAVLNLVNLWNEKAHENLPRLNLKTFDSEDKRYKAAKLRLKKNPDIEYWTKVIDRMNQSAFLIGNNARGWKANFEFLVRQQTHIDILEGKYDNKGVATVPKNGISHVRQKEGYLEDDVCSCNWKGEHVIDGERFKCPFCGNGKMFMFPTNQRFLPKELYEKAIKQGAEIYKQWKATNER